MQWFKGMPPATGYYWIKNSPRHSRAFGLAEVYIDPSSGSAKAKTPEGHVCKAFLSDREWSGPLPVPETEEWVGHDTSIEWGPGVVV